MREGLDKDGQREGAPWDPAVARKQEIRHRHPSVGLRGLSSEQANTGRDARLVWCSVAVICWPTSPARRGVSAKQSGWKLGFSASSGARIARQREQGAVTRPRRGVAGWLDYFSATGGTRLSGDDEKADAREGEDGFRVVADRLAVAEAYARGLIRRWDALREQGDDDAPSRRR